MSSFSPVAASAAHDRLRTALEEHRWTATVYGLGHIGIPLLESLAEHQVQVVGVDIDPGVIAALTAGSTSEARRVSKLVTDGRAQLTTSGGAADADVIFVCVPTPLDQAGMPDHSHVRDALRTIAGLARSGQLIAIESTVSVGATRRLAEEAFGASDLQLGRDIFVVHSPSRYNPGDARFPLATIPRVVGGVDATATELGRIVYESMTSQVRSVSSSEVAEMAKLFENSFRSVNIALVNELAMLGHDLRVDVWEVLDAASTKPFGFLAHEPGPGVGGHCIPIDPAYLVQAAREKRSEHTSMIERAAEINRAMPEYVTERLSGLLDSSLDGKHILIIGVTYKPDVADLRESPALDLIDILRQRGSEVAYHDPLVPELAASGLTSASLDDTVARADAVVIVTDHSAIDYELIHRAATRVLDTRNALRRRGLSGPHVDVL